MTYLLDVKCKQNVGLQKCKQNVGLQKKVDAEEISISFYGMYHVTYKLEVKCKQNVQSGVRTEG